jgi:hypothetical protein
LEPWIFYDFSIIFGRTIPTDELTPSFFRGVGQPPTSWDMGLKPSRNGDFMGISWDLMGISSQDG